MSFRRGWRSVDAIGQRKLQRAQLHQLSPGPHASRRDQVAGVAGMRSHRSVGGLRLGACDEGGGDRTNEDAVTEAKAATLAAGSPAARNQGTALSFNEKGTLMYEQLTPKQLIASLRGTVC